MQRPERTPTPTLDAILNPSRTPLERLQRSILAALQSKPIYGGTVPAKDVARNRAANKVARASRRANRKG